MPRSSAPNFRTARTKECSRAFRETDGGVILAAEEGNDLLGYVWARFVLDEGDIGNVAVAPDSRRRGIGAALLKALFAESERRGAAVLQLEVRESNLAARRLYEKNGFEIVGKRKNVR